MIKTTLRQITIARDTQALLHLGEQVPPGGVHFKVARLLNAVDEALRGFEKERVELFKKYGVPEVVSKDGKTVKTGNLTLVGADPDNILAFNDKMGALIETEIELNVDPLAWSLLAECQGKLTINDVRALGPLLRDDADEVAKPKTPIKIA
jgi:hypothetical protein